MSLSRDPLDTRARELFADFQTAPPPGAWDTIAARLEAPKRRRRGALWLWGLVVLGGVLGAYGVGEANSADEMSAEASRTSKQDYRSTAWNSPGEKPLTPNFAAQPPNVHTRRPELLEPEMPSRHAGVDVVLADSRDQNLTPTPAAGARGLNPPTQQPPGAGVVPLEPETFESIAGETELLRPLLSQPLHSLTRPLGRLEIPCEDFRRASGWHFGLRVFAGAGVPGRTWEPVDAELRDYRSLRDSTEVLRLEPAAGLRLEAHHLSGFFVRAGVDYLLARSTVSSRGPTTTTKTTVEVRDPISNNVIRVDTSTTVTYTELTTNNRHQRLALVGGVGYRLGGYRLQPYVVAEVGYGLLLHSRGRLPTQAGDSEQLSRESPYLRRSPGLQFGGTLGLDYRLRERLGVGVSVGYTVLGTLRAEGDPLDYRQRSAVAALNLVYGL